MLMSFRHLFENKVDFVLADVACNFPIWHVFEPLSLIPRNKQVDFIKSTMFFANMFLCNRRAITIMHANDLRVLKEINSFLESY
jgi:hypothetical protein